MPAMFSCRMEMAAWQKSMRLFASQVIPNAVANTLNRTANLVKAAAVHNIKQDLTVRTPYTLNALRVSPAHPHENLSGYSMVYTNNKYLPLQESGGTHTNPKIPTLEGSRSGSKMTIIPARLRLPQLAAAMQGAPAHGKARRPRTSKPFLLNPRGKPGIFIRQGKHLIMLRDLSKHTTRIKPVHWFTRAVEKFGTFPVMHSIFVKELKIQLTRIGGK